MSVVFSVRSLQSGINKRSAQTYSVHIWNLFLILATTKRRWRTNHSKWTYTKNCYALILHRLNVYLSSFICHRNSLYLVYVCMSFFVGAPFRQIRFNVIRKLRVDYYEIQCFCEEEKNPKHRIHYCVWKTTKIINIIQIADFFSVVSSLRLPTI